MATAFARSNYRTYPPPTHGQKYRIRARRAYGTARVAGGSSCLAAARPTAAAAADEGAAALHPVADAAPVRMLVKPAAAAAAAAVAVVGAHTGKLTPTRLLRRIAVLGFSIHRRRDETVERRYRPVVVFFCIRLCPFSFVSYAAVLI